MTYVLGAVVVMAGAGALLVVLSFVDLDPWE